MFSFFYKKDRAQEREAMKLINKITIPFGSRVWGGASRKSDYDFMVDMDNYNKLQDLFDISGIKYKVDSGGSYSELEIGLGYIINTRLCGNKIQICLPRSNNVEKFKRCIDMMTEYSKIEDMSHRVDRYHHFDLFMYIVKNKTQTLDVKLNKFMEEKYPEYLI